MRHALVTVIVLALAAAGSAGTAASAEAPAGAPNERSPAAALVERARGDLPVGDWARRAASARDVAAAGRDTAAITRVDRQSTFFAGYTDVCDDVSSPIDLRRTAVAEDSVSRDYVFFAESCQPWSAADLGEGIFEWVVFVPGGREDGSDYVVVLLNEGGALETVVLRTPSNNPSSWVVTAQSPAERVDDHTVAGLVPASAFDGADVFALGLASVDGQAREDYLPELSEPLVLYPDSCEALVVERLAVTTEPGRYTEAVAAARGAGLRVGVQAPGAGVFEAQRRSAGDAQTLAALPGVVDVRRPVIVERMAVPTAPAYPEQWALPGVRAPEAWEVRTGSGRTVAVIDDGVDATRGVLSGRVLAGHDTAFDRPLPAGRSSDRGGHGTAVAGVIAANGQAGMDIAGVDWTAQIIPYRVFDAAACGTDLEVAAAIDRATARGVDVMNLSIGATESTPTLRSAVRRAADAGVTMVAAVGNLALFGNAATYPASYPEVIGVGASTPAGEVADYSGTGPHVHLLAPGGDGSGTAAGDILTLYERQGILPLSGTSFAAPHVAGAALLYQAEHPDADPAQIAQALADSAEGDGARDDLRGHGVLDLAALLDIDPGSTAPPPPPGYPQVACPAGAPLPSSFVDTAGNFHESAIRCVVWWAIAQGGTDGRYAPAASVTREQMATFIARLLDRAGVVLPTPSDQGFGDIAGRVHRDRINQLAEVGVVRGTTATTYGPQAPVRRDQMASFLVRAFGLIDGVELPTGTPRFSDVAGNTHQDAINRAAAAGFARGTTDGRYLPGSDVRRDQMAAFITNVLDRLAADGRVAAPE